MEGLDQVLRWSDKRVHLLKVRYTDQYFQSLTNTVNFSDFNGAKVFETWDEIEQQFLRIPAQFKRGDQWEVLTLTLEELILS
jgi:predicted glycosyl hydrolase (DUF1957 family)